MNPETNHSAILKIKTEQVVPTEAERAAYPSVSDPVLSWALDAKVTFPSCDLQPAPVLIFEAKDRRTKPHELRSLGNLDRKVARPAWVNTALFQRERNDGIFGIDGLVSSQNSGTASGW